MTDENEIASDKVETPSLTPNEGIEAHLAKQGTDKPDSQPSETIAPDESSPSPEDVQAKETNGVQKRINDLTAQRYQEKRRADELEAKIAELTAAQPPQQIVQDLTPPTMPDDLYDDEAVKKYHADMAKYSQDVATQAAKSQFELQQKMVQEQKLQAQQQERSRKYIDGAIRDGVDVDKLRVVEQTLNNAGISAELGNYIVNDPNGAKIAEYLADNPAEMYEVLQMDSVSAGIKIATQVKPRALSRTPKISNAPDPIPEVKGGGFVEQDSFDKTYKGYEII